MLRVGTAGIKHEGNRRASFRPRRLVAIPVIAIAIVLTAFGVYAAQAEEGPTFTRYQQTDSRILYLGSWTTFKTTGASSGSYGYSDSKATALISFSGTQLDLLATMGYTMGTARIVVDGAAPTYVSLYSPTTMRQQKVWSTGILASGTHQVAISWAGQASVPAGGTRVNIDALDVAGNLTQASLALIEQTDTKIAYRGAWDVSSSSGASGGTFNSTSAQGSSATVFFTGTAVRYVATTGPSFGRATLTLDGGSPVYVDLYSSSLRYKRIMWSAFDLNAGNHVLTVSWTGQKNARAKAATVNLDAVMVAAIPTSSPSAGAATTTTSQPSPTTTTTSTTAGSTTTTTAAGSTTSTTLAPSTTTTLPSSLHAYYVDATLGNDSNDGTSTSRPWKSLAKVHNTTFQPGDTILFKRGEVWRDNNLYIDKGAGTAGAPITFGAYGTGAKPEINGGVDLSASAAWTQNSGNTWRTANSITQPQHDYMNEIGNVLFNDGQSIGVQKTSVGGCSKQGDYFYDQATGYLYLYSAGNPSGSYSKIEAARGFMGLCLTGTGRNYFTFQNLKFKNWGYHGGILGSENSTNFIVEYCDFDWNGGAAEGGARDGNGIMVEFARNSVIRYCHVTDSWETGISIQVMGGTAPQLSNFSMYGNLVERAGRAYFDTWYDSTSYTVRDLRIYNNTGYGIAQGLYTPQRGADRDHSGMVIDDRLVSQSGCLLKNNIFFGPASMAALQVQSHDVLAGWEIDNNCYFGGSVFNVDWANIPSSLWRSTYNKDGASFLNVDPLFVDPANGDFSLRPGSPCLQSGAVIPNTGQTTAPNIGAY
jgi:hypothetical protein